ncbi:MAG: tetratricopeptide repeat protein [Lachnospiraceae bacterium]
MIVFELYRQLDVRMYMTVAVLDRNYGSCAKYILVDDTLLLLGTNHSVKLNLMTKSVTEDQPIKDWDIDTEPLLWFAEESSEACVIRMINNAFRQWLEIDPFPSYAAFGDAMQEINAKLAGYHLRIIFDTESMCVYHEENIVTFEQALELIMEEDSAKEANADLGEWLAEAGYFRKTEQLEEAARRYERLLKHADRTQQLYTQCAFSLAEVYYFLGNYERSVILFYRCSLEFIRDEADFYIHLGHALLDSKMKKYERQIKIYYHGRIDAEYADTHRQAMEVAGREVGEVFDEYEASCYDMGQKKYAEYRNQLPTGADDIDELLLGDIEKQEKPMIVRKRYEDIKLVEPVCLTQTDSKSVNELLSEALNLFGGGEYQQAFDIYWLLRGKVTEDTDYSTWVQFQIGKLYCIFDNAPNAMKALQACRPERFGLVYRQEDFFLLYEHVKIVCDDFESDVRYRKLIRGKFDFYYAQYDREYNKLLHDRKLLHEYHQYERECMESAQKEFSSGICPESRMHSVEEEAHKKHPVFFKNMFKFFKEK